MYLSYYISLPKTYYYFMTKMLPDNIYQHIPSKFVLACK